MASNLAEWESATLGELGQFRNGVNFSQDDYGSGLPIVNVKQLYGGRYAQTRELLELRPSAVRNAELVELKLGDILFARSSVKASGAGQVAMVGPCPRGTVFSGFIIRFRVEAFDRADPGFLNYVLRSPTYRELLTRIGSGTTITNLSQETLAAIEVDLPLLPEQRTIANILGTLDDKIELNRRMNETLETMARALFKSWFVDFDPVRAKAEGRDPGLPKPLADLFPARLVDSELGEIPEGWEVGVLGNTLDELEVGNRPKGGVSGCSEGVPSIGAESIVGLGIFDYSKTKHVPQEFFEGMTKGHVKSRDVILYKDGGRPGEFEPHVTLFGDGFPFSTCAINEHVYRLRAKSTLGQNFLFFWLSSDLVMEQMRIKGTGVAIPGLNSTQVKSLTTLVPKSDVIRAFDAAVDPWVTRVLASCNESRTVAALRDALLPKLISGELRVKDAEAFVGRAV